MDLGALRTLALDLNFTAHGVPITVTLPHEESFTATGIWAPRMVEDLPAGTDFTRREPRLIMALRRAEVSETPRGTVIAAPEKAGGTIRSWQVDGVESTEADHVKVILVPETL